jgi:hypothetical protein
MARSKLTDHAQILTPAESQAKYLIATPSLIVTSNRHCRVQAFHPKNSELPDTAAF